MPMVRTLKTAQLLPDGEPFQNLLLPYFAPYLVYVGISSLPETVIPANLGQLLKMMATAATLLFFIKKYRFGPFRAIHGCVAVLALPIALLCWVGPFYLLTAFGLIDVIDAGDHQPFSLFYFSLRVINTVILVAVFEELFIRVYVMGWLHQAGSQRHEKGLVESIVGTLEQEPVPGVMLPLSTFSVLGATVVFTAGHQAYEYLSAISYFLFTSWLFKKSGSLWVCIIIHGFTNLTIAILVRYGGMGWLW